MRVVTGIACRHIRSDSRFVNLTSTKVCTEGRAILADMEATNVQTAVVTGAASGFGRAIADQVGSRGAGVAMLDIDGDRVTDAASEVRTSHGVDAIAARVDVSSREELDRAADTVSDRFGQCDLLWVNVGVQHFGTVESTPEAVWRWMFDVNVVGAVNTVQAFLPLLRQADRSWIAFTASTNALAPAARLGAYQASKCAVVGLAETLRLELAPRVDRGLGGVPRGDDHPAPGEQRGGPARRARPGRCGPGRPRRR